MRTPGSPRKPRRTDPRLLPKGVRVVYEDEDVLVVDKPVALVTADPSGSGRGGGGGRPSARSGETLFDVLKDHLRDTAGKRRRDETGRTSPRLWIVHRLDKEASGLLVFAKSEKAFGWLKEDFRAKRVHRIYHAVAEGVVGEPGFAGTRQSFLQEGGSDARRRPGARGRRGGDDTDEDDAGKLAVTHYRVLAAGQGRTLLEVRLETGRKNQIRIHASELGHPLVGDRRFGATTDPIGRLGLHAAELGFTHPETGATVRFESRTPGSFYRAVGAKPVVGGATSDDTGSGEADPAAQSARHQPRTGGSSAEPAGGTPAPLKAPGPKKQKAADTSWDEVASWYDELLEDRGNDHYERVILPGALRLLGPTGGMRVLDVACGQGILCRRLAALGVGVVGVDGAPRLIEAARGRGAKGPGSVEYRVGDARELAGLGLRGFDAATCVMALANIDPLEPVFTGVAAALREGGRLIGVITHPAFRAPGQTSWGWDEKSKRQFRRVDGYLSPGQTEIQMHPGKAARGEGGATTWTFHRPVQTYVENLAKAGFLIERLEEWPSLRASTSGPRAAEENRVRREIPMFLGFRAVKR